MTRTLHAIETALHMATVGAIRLIAGKDAARRWHAAHRQEDKTG